MSEGEKPKTGRPARAAGETRNYTLRLTDAELEAFQAEADAAGQKRADWIRESCLIRIAKRLVQTPNKVPTPDS